jgi:hypothetical protein
MWRHASFPMNSHSAPPNASLCVVAYSLSLPQSNIEPYKHKFSCFLMFYNCPLTASLLFLMMSSQRTEQ